jgi:effector-binding domain-containing protein
MALPHRCLSRNGEDRQLRAPAEALDVSVPSHQVHETEGAAKRFAAGAVPRGFAMRRPIRWTILAMLAMLGTAPLGAQQPPAQPAPPTTTPAAPPAQAPAPESSASPAEVTLEPRPVLMLSGESTWDDGYENLMKAFDSLKAEAKRLGLTVTGKPLAAFQETDDQKFKYDAMVTLEREPAAEVKPQGGISLGKSLAGKAYKFTHVGAYDDIDSVYEAITAWLDEKGLTSKGAFVEEYVNAPTGSDDSKLELNIYVFVQ